MGWIIRFIYCQCHLASGFLLACMSAEFVSHPGTLLDALPFEPVWYTIVIGNTTNNMQQKFQKTRKTHYVGTTELAP